MDEFAGRGKKPDIKLIDTLKNYMANKSFNRGTGPQGAEASMGMHFQVADIHRPLLSLSRAADQGFRSYLDWYGGYLEDTNTGECIPIQRRGNLYVIQIWVRGSIDKPPDTSGFARRG